MGHRTSIFYVGKNILTFFFSFSSCGRDFFLVIITYSADVELCLGTLTCSTEILIFEAFSLEFIVVPMKKTHKRSHVTLIG